MMPNTAVVELRVRHREFKEVLIKLVECGEYDLISQLIAGIQVFDFSSKAIRKKD